MDSLQDNDGLMLNLSTFVPKKRIKNNSAPISKEETNDVHPLAHKSNKIFSKKIDTFAQSPGKTFNNPPSFNKKNSHPENALNSNDKKVGHTKKVSNSSSNFKPKTSRPEKVFSSLFKSNPEVHPLVVRKQTSLSEPLFSTKTFEELDLHPHLVACLKQRMEIVRMTKVQESTIPVLLEENDALVKSCTGSGKTLAYAIPIIQKFQEMEPKIKRSDGVKALIIAPTRELAIQSYETFSTLTKAFTWIVPGYLIGGEKKKSEKARLRKGINILICTPGRLLDHLDRTYCLSLEKISWLVIDEADKLLEQGFEDSVKKILSKCNKERSSVLLSATLTKEVENLAVMSLSDPTRIDVASGNNPSNFEDFAIPSNLKQFLVVVPSKLRLATLSGFIIDNCLRNRLKALIFMSSQNTVDFHYNLFSGVLAPLLINKGHKCKFFKLQGSMKQEERTEIFSVFKKEKEGVLFCTDVAARGLDLPYVDWIVQYSAPSSPEIYIHRVGRTARIGKKGNSLLFLLPSEAKFSHLLAEHRINFEELTTEKFLQPLLLISESMNMRSKATAEECATALQSRYEKEVYEEKELHNSAKEAFASYIQSYASYSKSLRHVLPFKALHLGHVAKSFCLREAPSTLKNSVPFKKYSRFEKRSNFDRRSDKSLPMKRKRQGTVSEFDSGLSFFASESERKTKKRKKH